MGKQTVNKVEMTNLDDKCCEGSERGRTDTGGKAGTRPGQVPPCHPGPDAGLDLGGCTQWTTAKSSELRGATRSLHTPCRHGPNPSTAGAIQSNRNNTTPGWRHPTPPGPSLCIPADTPGGRPETRMHWEGGCLQLSSVLTLCMFEHSTTGVLKEQLSPWGVSAS